MLKVGNMAVMPDPLPVEIKKRKNRASQRDTDISRRRREKGEDTEEIGHQDEDGNRTNPRDVFDPFVPNVLFQQILDPETKRIGKKQFRDLLKAARALDGEARAKQKRQERANNQYEKTHHNMFRDGQIRIFGANVERREQRQGESPEVMVHQLR